MYKRDRNTPGFLGPVAVHPLSYSTQKLSYASFWYPAQSYYRRYPVIKVEHVGVE